MKTLRTNRRQRELCCLFGISPFGVTSPGQEKWQHWPGTHSILISSQWVLDLVRPDFFVLCIDIFFSDDFENNTESGVVCVYSLKNPSHPEYQCWTSHGVISLDIHPRHSHMIAVGLKNGDVAVFNLQKPCTEPSHQVKFSLINPLGKGSKIPPQ